MKKFLLICLAGSCLFLLAGCKQTKPKFAPFNPRPVADKPAMTTIENPLDPALLQSPTNHFTLGPGDRVEIELLDEPASRVTTVVGPDGKIYFNLLPGIDVWGMTMGEAKRAIERELGNYIRGTPRVNITLRGVESKRVWLLGRFQQPGVYIMATPMTLLEAISMAGGSMTFSGAREALGGPLSEDLTDFKKSFVIRQGRLLPVDFRKLLTEGDLSQNIYLEPDDFVYFAPTFSREVYVLGAVVQPKPVPYSEGLTVAGAIAGAYGTVRDAYLYHVVIVRGSLTQPEAAVVNYKDIVNGRAPDVELQPHDIVYVPLAPYRYLRKYAEIALNTFVSSVAINAGTKIVGQPRGGGAAGVLIPVGSGIQIIQPPAPPVGR